MSNPFYNSEGYPDPTTYEALKPLIREENALNKRVHDLINVLKFIIDRSGFELIKRIEIRDKKTGKEFK